MKKLFIIIGLVFATLLVPYALSAPVSAEGGIDIYGGSACEGANANTDFCKNRSKTNIDSVIKPIIDFLLYIVAIIAVIVIIVSGIKYLTSSGDTSKVASAKNTLTYAIVGLVVAIFAYSIVQFVYSKIK